jgi:hypothetical protein
MEIATVSKEGNEELLNWILDHHHFLLCSFFDHEELQSSLALVSRKFNQKVMSIFLWRTMMAQLSDLRLQQEGPDKLERTALTEQTEQTERTDWPELQPLEFPTLLHETELAEDLLESSQIIGSDRCSNPNPNPNPKAKRGQHQHIGEDEKTAVYLSRRIIQAPI